jgi:hypothetical protein
MAWNFSSRQSTVSALVVVEDDAVEVEDTASASDSPYCVGPCTCGNNCHLNVEYHDKVTRFDPDAEVDDEQYEYALSLLGGG